MIKPNRRPTPGPRSQDGYALLFTFIIMIFLTIIFTATLDRTVNERNDVLKYYYRTVALDLAESGINLAAARLAGGQPVPDSFFVDTYRGLRGEVKIQVQRSGPLRITATGILTDRQHRIVFQKTVQATGSLAAGRLQITAWKELPD